MVSIILPIRNEVRYIRQLLESILNQQFTGEGFEILITDGMSTDGTRKIIKEYAQYINEIHLIDNPENIVSTGFNRALSISKGHIIIRVDGHADISSDFLENCLEVINKIDADCVGGKTKHVAIGIIGHAVNFAQSSMFGLGGVVFRKSVQEGIYVDTLAFGAYKRGVFETIGGYDEELVRNQDDEFNFRLIQNGGKIWLDPTIKSTYYPRNSLIKLFKQYFQYGFYKIRVMQKRRGFASWRHLVPGIFVLSLLLSFIFILATPNEWFFYLITGSYAIANILATFWEIIKKTIDKESRQSANFSLSTFLLLPLIYFILHFSYGLGFICGLVYFWNKWNDRKVKDHHLDKEHFKLNANA